MLNYVNFMKDAKKLTTSKPAKGRTVLKGVNHTGDYVEATNGHVLYRASYESDVKLIDVNGQPVEGNYPDVSRLIPVAEDAKVSNVVDVVQAVNFFTAVKKVAGKDANIDVVDGVAVYDDGTVKLSFNLAMKDASLTINNEYLLNTFTMLKNQQRPTAKMYYYSAVRPLFIEAYDIQVIVMPIRKS